MRRTWAPPASQLGRGFTLVEVTIALGVAAFCLLAVFGLLQSGVMTEKATVSQTVANDLLSAIYTDLTTTPADQPNTPVYKIALEGATLTDPQTLYFTAALKPTGAVGIAPTAESRYRATVGTQAPSASDNDAGAATLARIVVSWPAQSDPTPTQWPTQASGSVEVVTALNR